ncbi:hypothetical protein FRC08_018409 [Ceratobasidium sp. 394]|nr:hypothetical protein FRC08_018409 [Ceratobasidium sp. 394]KAG9095258.1 hypothetical protein FS749_010796 [Ceratobasidium sp. UAMH 11750]
MPPKRVKAEKAARASAARCAPREEDEEMEVPQEEEDEAAKLERVLASIANYPDQPLEGVQEDKIRVLGSDLRVHDQLYSQAIEAMSDTAVMLADALPGGEDPFENEEIMKIKASLLELLDMQHISALHLDALDADVRKPVGSGRKIVDPASIFNTGMQQRIDSYKSQTARQKYAKSKAFKTFVEAIWESGHSEAMPPVIQFLPRGPYNSSSALLFTQIQLTEDGDPEDSDDDMEVGGVTQEYKCPLTLKIYTDPLTSTVCGHTFSAEGIRAFLEGKNSDNCPGTGCNQRISMSVLKLDRGIQKKAIAAERRAEKNKGEQTDSDIDED